MKKTGKIEEHYFVNDKEFYKWLKKNHKKSDGVYLIFYTVAHEKESMRWEEAVKVALCFGWIDSTVKSLGEGKRRQYFSPRNPKSVWSRVNKNHIEELTKQGLMHPSGLKAIEVAKKNRSWFELDDVEDGIVPPDLQKAFDKNKKAFEHYQDFTRSQKKHYLYWLHSAKREETRQKRIKEIIEGCTNKQKLNRS